MCNGNLRQETTVRKKKHLRHDRTGNSSMSCRSRRKHVGRQHATRRKARGSFKNRTIEGRKTAFGITERGSTLYVVQLKVTGAQRLYEL